MHKTPSELVFFAGAIYYRLLRRWAGSRVTQVLSPDCEKGNFLFAINFSKICKGDTRFIYSFRAIAILLKYFIFLRFAQLDVRPALDSAEAIQDRMKVQSKNTNTCWHCCFYHVPPIERLPGGGSRQSGWGSCQLGVGRRRVSEIPSLSFNTLETFPYLLLSDQVTVKIIVLVEYSFWS